MYIYSLSKFGESFAARLRSRLFKAIMEQDISRIIEMAWEDRTPFDAIKKQFGLNEDALKKLMRKNMKSSSYHLWRKRVYGRKTKHLGKRDFLIGRHKSSDQNKL